MALRDYPTLQSVIGFVYTMRPDLADDTVTRRQGDKVTEPTVAAPSAASPVTQSPGHSVTLSAVQTIGTLEDADKMPRRVPVPSLRPAIEFTKPTGVTLGSGSRVVVMLDRGGVGKALVNRLEKLGAAVLTLEPGVATDALEAQLKGWLADGPIQGVYWLPALDVEPAIEAMSLEEWREHNRIRVKNLYTAMRALYDAVRGPNTFLVSATRLGGLHGYGDVGATAPLGGAVSGFTKAYNMEQALRAEDAGKGITVKVVDFEAGRKTAEPADALLAETLYDPGIVEVGYKDGLRYTVTLVEKPAPRRPARHGAGQGDRLRGHRRGRRHHQRHHHRSGRGTAAAASSICWTWWQAPARDDKSRQTLPRGPRGAQAGADRRGVGPAARR
ncbi:MAG: hypothetical protein V9H69_14820 [Anaerolineae bacterium]